MIDLLIDIIQWQFWVLITQAALALVWSVSFLYLFFRILRIEKNK